MVRVHELFFSIPEQYSEEMSLLSLFIKSGARLIDLKVVTDNDHRHDPELDKVNPPSVLMLRNLQYWLSLIVLSRRGTSR